MAAHVPDQKHLALLKAIGRALELEGPYEEFLGERKESGENLQVLDGAVDAPSGRVAWIEERSRERKGDFVPVSFTLVVAWGGLRHIEVEVPTYNPYFGCSVQFMGWFSESLGVIYREKHLTLAARLELPDGTLRLMAIDEPCAVDGDTVYFVSNRPGLVEARMLPSLAPGLPVPVESVSQRLEIWPHAPGVLAAAERPSRKEGETHDAHEARIKAIRASPRKIPLPSPAARALRVTPERLWARLHELLAETAPPKHGVDVWVGAVATPFWRDECSRGSRYEQVGGRENHPAYLPVYWYLHLQAQRRTKEAEAWLRWLDRLAALQPEWEPWTHGVTGEELAARTALTHLRHQAASLAEVCRTGRLPELAWCYFFTRPEPAEALLREETFPSGFRQVLRELATHPPKSLSER